MSIVKLLCFSFCLFVSSLFSISSNTLQSGNLNLTVENILKPQGNIMIAIFEGPDNFLKDDKVVGSKIGLVEKTGSFDVIFPNLPFGEYSIAVYHDVNGNQKLDTNLFGVPTEPYGFSNNARSKWGAPKYNVAKFQLNESEKKMVIQVKKWSKQ